MKIQENVLVEILLSLRRDGEMEKGLSEKELSG